jgi:hypothetical protein
MEHSTLFEAYRPLSPGPGESIIFHLEEALTSEAHQAKRRKIAHLAERCLDGGSLHIYSASLRGSFDNWKNPWKRSHLIQPVKNSTQPTTSSDRLPTSTHAASEDVKNESQPQLSTSYLDSPHQSTVRPTNTKGFLKPILSPNRARLQSIWAKASVATDKKSTPSPTKKVKLAPDNTNTKPTNNSIQLKRPRHKSCSFEEELHSTPTSFKALPVSELNNFASPSRSAQSENTSLPSSSSTSTTISQDSADLKVTVSVDPLETDLTAIKKSQISDIPCLDSTTSPISADERTDPISKTPDQPPEPSLIMFGSQDSPIKSGRELLMSQDSVVANWLDVAVEYLKDPFEDQEMRTSSTLAS